MLILASLVASAAAPTGRRLTHENVEPSLRTPLDYTEAELLNKTCTPRDSYTNLTFDNAHLVLSNLGGQGGRCVDTCYTGDGAHEAASFDGASASTTDSSTRVERQPVAFLSSSCE